MSTAKKSTRKGGTRKQSKRGDFSVDDLSQRDRDILTMTPKDAAVKYNTTGQKISVRKNFLWKKFGKGFIPQTVSPTQNQTSNFGGERKEPNNQRPGLKVSSAPKEPFLAAVEINNGNFLMRIKDRPRKITVDPGTNIVTMED